MVRAVGGIEQQLAARLENRGYHGDIGKVRAAEKRVITDNHISRRNTGNLPGNLSHALAHGPEMNWNVRGIGNQPAGGVEDGAGEIKPLPDIG